MRRTFLQELISWPWWLLAALAVVVFFSAEFMPDLGGWTGQVLRNFWPRVSAWISLGMLLLAAFSWYRRHEQRQWFLGTNSWEALRALSWQQFEAVVAEAFRRQGFHVKQFGGAHADGGVDLLISNAQGSYVVQCKHWKAREVGVPTVREMLGVAVHERVAGAYIVTCGRFSRPAKLFAHGKPLILIDGKALLGWMKTLS